MSKKQQSTFLKLAKNPLVQRVVAWLVPMIVGFIVRRITGGKKSAKPGRKYVKNKAD